MVLTRLESFETTVKAVDAEGKPLAQKLTLKVLEQTVVEGKVGEVEVEHHDLETDKTGGAARQTPTRGWSGSGSAFRKFSGRW